MSYKTLGNKTFVKSAAKNKKRLISVQKKSYKKCQIVLFAKSYLTPKNAYLKRENTYFIFL